jgi:ESCRT-II complex subunit VPS36
MLSGKTHWKASSVSATTGRDKLEEKEDVLLMCTRVSLYVDEKKVHANGQCTVTTHKLLWNDGGVLRMALPLASVAAAAPVQGLLGASSTKFVLTMARPELKLPAIKAAAPAATAAAATAALAVPWACAACTFENKAAAAACSMCTTPNAAFVAVVAESNVPPPLASKSTSSASTAETPLPSSYRIAVTGDNRDKFLKTLTSSLQARAWLHSAATTVGAAAANEPKRAPQSTRSAGISGLMRSAAAAQTRNEGRMVAATADLDALMGGARDVVKLLEKYTAAMQRGDDDGGDGDEGGGGGKSSDDANVRAMLRDMGVGSPVTRAAAGKSFHSELARQIAGLLTAPLPASRAKKSTKKTTTSTSSAAAAAAAATVRPTLLSQSGGVMTLTDVYCVVNRARGTALVSPDDTLSAARLFSTLKLPVKLTQYDSGVLVVEASATAAAAAGGGGGSDMESVCAAVDAAAAGCLTDVALSTLFSISVVVARQRLEAAEKCLHLCRDATVDGTYFYPNAFRFF